MKVVWTVDRSTARVASRVGNDTTFSPEPHHVYPDGVRKGRKVRLLQGNGSACWNERTAIGPRCDSRSITSAPSPALKSPSTPVVWKCAGGQPQRVQLWVLSPPLSRSPTDWLQSGVSNRADAGACVAACFVRGHLTQSEIENPERRASCRVSASRPASSMLVPTALLLRVFTPISIPFLASLRCVGGRRKELSYTKPIAGIYPPVVLQ